MLEHPNIKIMLNTDFREIRDIIPFRELIYTGPIDAYFDHQFGQLPYRSLEFHFETHNTPQYQCVATVNYPNDYEFTRITEFKHLTGQAHRGTSLVREYPQADGDPYYPVPRPENELLFKRYEALALQEQNVTFVGRLAQYRYYNMDQCVGAALKSVEYILEKMGADAEKAPVDLLATGSTSAATPAPLIGAKH